MYRPAPRCNHMGAYLPPTPEPEPIPEPEPEYEDDEDRFIPEPIKEKKYLCGEKLLKSIRKEEKRNRIDPDRLSKSLSRIVKIF